MAKTSRWSWWDKPSGKDRHRAGQLISALWPIHARTIDAWLWRGHSNSDFNLTQGAVSRLRAPSKTSDASIVSLTSRLLVDARAASLDTHEGINLPDMALLAMLQHHGAGTPLLDVSFDPLIALYMAIEEPNGQIEVGTDGVLFAIKRPERIIPAFDARKIDEIYRDLPRVGCTLFIPPFVSERLRIQRGAFLISHTSTADGRTTMNLNLPRPNESKCWIHTVIEHVGKPGAVAVKETVGAFRVPGRIKPELKQWLDKRTGLTSKDVVIPPAWHRPHLDAFCSAHSRSVPFTPSRAQQVERRREDERMRRQVTGGLS